jgi:hypothetical protein
MKKKIIGFALVVAAFVSITVSGCVARMGYDHHHDHDHEMHDHDNHDRQ